MIFPMFIQEKSSAYSIPNIVSSDTLITSAIQLYLGHLCGFTIMKIGMCRVIGMEKEYNIN